MRVTLFCQAKPVEDSLFEPPYVGCYGAAPKFEFEHWAIVCHLRGEDNAGDIGRSFKCFKLN